MDILVTGGAGFIGGHLAESFAREGHDVTVLDNLDPYYDTGIKQQNIEIGRQAAAADNRTDSATSTADGDDETLEYDESDVPEPNDGGYEFVEGDVRDPELVEQLVDDVDVVYHQAAQAGVRTSVDDPRKPNDINVDGTLNVLDAARDTDIERVVLASSSSVYGKPEYLPYDEEHPTTPVSPYGVSKLAGEQYARVYNEVYGLPTVSLRYFTVYGPRMRPNMAISNFVSRCLSGKPPVVYGDGSQTRDFTYIDDVVAMNRTLMTDDSADGEILNVGSTGNIDILTLAETIRDEIDPSLELEFAEQPTGDAQHTHSDVSKASELVGYEPTTTIREGVSQFIDWYKANREWYEPLVLQS
ncbi:SDR family oxidoreductase [Natronolimnohabitans sp. A-GB9]|uniref:SDR family oxidoreductase n=1 Tax=Natronolimnohabitans sp. A-GB9 TaxID=3069757 RepID=UPI0027B43536|nr:SDR family oxidoreductase [Natronolimnohabitans sp. A-GB9]MDQ2052610.1 SDR family oxidoreductase [Natronolimnohabitans sp. A-GB9]